jgi:hypothetical protein
MDMQEKNRANTGLNLKRLEKLLQAGRLTADELGSLSDEEQIELKQMARSRIDELNNEHTRLLQMLADMSDISYSRMNWESNHLKISKAIQTSLFKTGRIPTQTYISEITGLSRQTVNKHMAEGDAKSVLAEQLDHFAMMAPVVMGKLLHAVLEYRSLPAMKMYFDLLERTQGRLPVMQQNNFIQINNTVLKQETLQQLSTEQLKQIEEVIKGSLKNMPAMGAGISIPTVE